MTSKPATAGIAMPQPGLLMDLESRAVIRFQDCDPFGHLNNARYIDYFMNAREDQLAAAYNFDIFGHTAASGHGWVVSQSQIAYLAPAGIKEEVLIRTRLIHRDRSRLVVEGEMFDAAGQYLKAVAWMAFVYVDVQGGMRAHHGPDLMALFDAVVYDGVYEEAGFPQRVKDRRKAARDNRH